MSWLDSVDWNDPLSYIRERYRVPAFFDRRVTVCTGEQGYITGADAARLLVLIDGETKPRIFHPTWRMEYHEARPVS